MNTGSSDCIKWHVGGFIKLRMSEIPDILSFIHRSTLLIVHSDVQKQGIGAALQVRIVTRSYPENRRWLLSTTAAFVLSSYGERMFNILDDVSS